MPLFGYVPEGFEVNGTIREFGTGETLLKESTFVTASHFSAHKIPYGSRRGTVLGTNMYITAYQVSGGLTGAKCVAALFISLFCRVPQNPVHNARNTANIERGGSPLRLQTANR